jgi:signal transduction histidine kinase
VSVARIDVDGEAYLFGVVRDVTERKQMEAAQRSFTQRMLETLEAERQRVARELHDDVGQAVTSVGELIRSLEQTSSAVPDEARPTLAATHAMIREITESVARIVRDYHPAEILGLGLEESICTHARQFAERHGLTLRLIVTPVADLLSHEQELHVFRVVQEALANVARHANAREVTIRLRGRPRQVTVSVQDDGSGFDPARMNGSAGLGLVTMRERAELMHAVLEVRSSPGSGTEIQIVVPVKARAPMPPVARTRQRAGGGAGGPSASRSRHRAAGRDP